MINTNDILETINMIQSEHLDIRTITMGINLMDCMSSGKDAFADRIYEKISRRAERLVSVGEAIEKKYGIPIINKRISVTPVALAGNGLDEDGFIKAAHALDKAAKSVGVNFIGGYSALVQKGMTDGDKRMISTIPQVLTETDILCSSVNLGSTKTGINMDAVIEMGKVIKKTAYLTRDNSSFGCGKLVVFANAPDDNPFMAGAFHGVSEGETVINVGVSGPGVVSSAISKAGNVSVDELAEVIKRTSFKITRVGQLVAKEAAGMLDASFGIVDLSLAPTPAMGDSVARILEAMGLETCGCCGTTACLAMLNDAVKKGGIMASSHVGGLSGAFIPVSEDEGMIAAVKSGVLKIEKLEAMTAVCSVGLDMIAIPGDTDESVISGIIADEAAIGVINGKTTAVRVIPAYGKKAGDVLDFGGLFGEAPVMPVSTKSPKAFISRGGTFPAPVHSMKN